MSCPHSLLDTPERCSLCLEARGEIAVPVRRVEITGPIVPAPSPRSAYGRRSAIGSRRVTRSIDDDQDDNHG